MIGMLSPDEIESTLARSTVGRIGCSANDRPYIVPITYAYADGYVYAYSVLGRKIRVMREQPLVCFEVEEIDGPNSWRSVIAEGEYEELTDTASRNEARRHLGMRGDDAVPRSVSVNSNAIFFRLRLTETSGRFERRDA